MGATGKSGDEVKSDRPPAPKCDTERQRGCEVFCELTDGGLVCEGLSSGTYRVGPSQSTIRRTPIRTM